jgi:exosome complex RNA-binding protein Rrp4
VGVVTARLGESYRVDIGSAHSANLDALAFEGATKRNRPNLKVSKKIIDVDTLHLVSITKNVSHGSY